MEFHWYENYYGAPHGMPRMLPRGHQFAVGFYMTERLIRFRTEFIHSDGTKAVPGVNLERLLLSGQIGALSTHD